MKTFDHPGAEQVFNQLQAARKNFLREQEYDRMCAAVVGADLVLTHYKDKLQELQTENDRLKAEIEALKQIDSIVRLVW